MSKFRPWNSDIQCKELVFVDNIIQHFIQWGEFSTWRGSLHLVDWRGRVENWIGILEQLI